MSDATVQRACNQRKTLDHRLILLSFGNGYRNATFEPLTSTFEPLLNLPPLANFRTTNYLTPAVVVEEGEL